MKIPFPTLLTAAIIAFFVFLPLNNAFFILSQSIGKEDPAPDQTFFVCLKMAVWLCVFAVIMFKLIRDFDRTIVGASVFILAAASFMAVLILFFTDIYMHYGIVTPDKDTTKGAAACLYFSIVTWTTLGFGDFRPTPSARMFAAVEAVIGYIYMAVFVGLFAQLFYSFATSARKRRSARA